MAALLLVGQHLDAPLRTDDHRTRSRRFLRRGLLLSGALHLSLLFVFLSLTNRGDEGLVRVIEGRTGLLPPIIDYRLPPPVFPRDGGAPPAEGGIYTAVNRDLDDFVDLPIPRDVSVFSGGEAGPGGPPREGNDGPPAPPAPPRDGPYERSEVDVPPVEIHTPKPVYPEIAKEMGLTGRVVLRVLVGPDGGVRNVRVLSGPRILSENAQEALYRWRFRPARVRGTAVSVWVEVPVVYVL